MSAPPPSSLIPPPPVSTASDGSPVWGQWLTPDAAGDSARLWFVLHTRSRQEKAVAGQLDSLGVPHFLPLQNQIRYFGRSKQTVALPLFTGYVFMLGHKEQAYASDRSRRLVNVIPVADPTRLDWELRNLHLALTEHAVEFNPHPHLRAGVRVIVRAGPFKGLEGLIERRERADRIILQVDMLSRALSVEIDGALLDVVDPDGR